MADPGIEVFLLPDAEDTHALASVLAARLEAGDVVALDGDLGAGKTCFVRGLAEGLGIDPQAVSSPTYVSMQQYGGGRVSLAHVDAWRMKSAADLATIGWDELIADRKCVVAVEWASRVSAALPPRRIDITLAPAAAGGRVALVDDRRHTSPASRCRTCGAASARHEPFCSPRCRAADLHRWLSGAYRIAGSSSEHGDSDDFTQ